MPLLFLYQVFTGFPRYSTASKISAILLGLPVLINNFFCQISKKPWVSLCRWLILQVKICVCSLDYINLFDCDRASCADVFCSLLNSFCLFSRFYISRLYTLSKCANVSPCTSAKPEPKWVSFSLHCLVFVNSLLNLNFKLGYNYFEFTQRGHVYAYVSQILFLKIVRTQLLTQYLKSKLT